MTFDAWMRAIDRICTFTFGMSIHDLPDMHFRDAFDDGLTPVEFMEENVPDLDALGKLILG